MGTGALYFWAKRSGHEADHSLPSGAGVKNEWSYTFSSHLAFLECIGFTYISGFTFAVVEKVKVKFSLEQTMKARRGSRGIALLFL
jgi:hypothetical protein